MRAVTGWWGRLFLVVLGAAAALSLLALDDLRFRHDTRSLLRTDRVADAREAELAATFGSEDLLLVAWEVESATDIEEFRALRALAAELDRVPGLEEMYSLASERVQLRIGDELRAIREQDLETDAGRAAVRLALLRAPVYLDTIYNRSLDVVAIAGTLQAGAREKREAALRTVREIARRHERPGRTIHVAGVTALAVDAGEYAVSDLKRIGLLALAVSAVVLLVLCRSVSETLVALLATGLPPLFALACAVLLDVPITALGAALFPMLAVVGITGSVHLLNAYGEELRGGSEPAAAAVRAAWRLARPISLSLATTAFAFASLRWTGVPAFRSGGLIVALGMLLAIPVVLLGLPAALALLRPRARLARAGGLARTLRAAAAWVLQRRSWVIGAGVFLCVAGAALATRARLQVDVLQAFQPESAIAQTYRFLEDRLTAVIPTDAVLDAHDGVDEVEVLRELERFSDDALEDPYVTNAMSLATLVRFGKSVSPIPVGDRGALLVLRTPLFAPITRRFEDRAIHRYRVRLRLREGAPPEVLDRLEGHAADFTTGEAKLTGLYVRAVGTTRHVIRDLGYGALLMAGVVVATIAVFLRSWRLALAAVVPNLLPPAVVFGCAVALGQPLDVAAVAVGAVAVGLAVDDTLHVLFRFAEERRGGRDLEDAIAAAHGSVGRALVLSTVVLAAGLGCLALSAFKPTAHFGLFTAAACAVALPADLIVLPAFVRAFRAP
ncbi:MAG: efflux RND transporter permease subunit [Planctomycetota bacterium]|jgi:predicted RND superfamily exporter protein